MAAEERVLCFERKHLEQLGVFQGLSLDVEKYLSVVTDPKNLVYKPRSEAELDKNYKQLIPYVILVHNGRVLHYQRGKGGGETRLHGFYSIGIGGHIADEDASLFSHAGYRDGMLRELREEVDIDLKDVNETAVALINDDSNEVGYVHFGVVHIMQVPNENVVGNRKGIRAPEFVPFAKALAERENYESWSRICLDQFEKILALAAIPN